MVGVVVNVAVAWGCARWSRATVPKGDDYIGFGITHRCEHHVLRGRKGEMLSRSAYILDTRVGWPMRCAQLNRHTSFKEWCQGLCDDLPVAPLWLGGIVNTVLYGVMLWLVICGQLVLRRLLRRTRRRCPMCGYDLRGELGGGCPECGWGRAVEAAP